MKTQLLRFLLGTPKEKNPDEQLKALRSIPKLLRMVWKTNPKMAFWGIFLRILTAFLPLTSLYFGKLIIDQVVLLIQNPNLSTQNLWLFVFVELMLAILSDWLSRTIQTINVLIGELFAHESSIRLIEHAASLDLAQFEDAKFYDTLEKARQQTNNRSIILWEILSIAQRLITVFFLSFGLIAFNPYLLVILFLAVLPSFISENRFNVLKRSMFMTYTPQRRELDYLRKVGADDQTAKEIKVFGLSDFLVERFDFLSKKYYTANRQLTIKSAFWGGLLFSVGTLAYYAAYALIVWKTFKGSISIGDLTFLAGSFMRMREQLQAVMEMFSGMSAKALYLQDFFDFFDIKPQIQSPKNPVAVPKIIQKGFIFENVSYKYPNSNKYSLKNLSFQLKAGEKMALVGENGAGKTTLVKLLSRLYEPTEGRILLDGVDLKDYDLASLRQLIGVIFQDFVRFQFSASENIAVGDILSRTEHQKIVSSAEKSLADELIKRLPKQYEQMLGHKFTESVELSGGEWQKIAIARAYMRDAQVLILDEPTAALDARAEHEIFERFTHLTANKTAVLISHRFSTVRMADRILFLEKGELRELGSHHELMQLNGKYAELFSLQAKAYQ